jgi:hypothetical protein
MRGGRFTAGDAVSLSVISSSRDCSCFWVFWEDVRLLGREDEESDLLRFRPRGADVVAADADVVVVVEADDEGSGSGS